MNTLSIVAIAFLSLAIALVVGGTLLSRRSNERATGDLALFPFSGSVEPGTGKVSLANSSGHPQIDCSARGRINIVGAFVDVEDPYGECTSKPSASYNLACGYPGGGVSCKTNGDCGSGLKCSGGGCVPRKAVLTKDGKIDTKNSECDSQGGTYCPVQPGAQCKVDTDCGDGNVMKCVGGGCVVRPGRQCFGVNVDRSTCASFPLCSNSGVEKKGGKGKNAFCSPGGAGKCVPRDASAFLARKCDGKVSCPVSWDSNDTDWGFGPLPCSLPGKGRLPVVPRNGGKYREGYRVHGIYACV